ncbi:TPA_asm: hypothetical protein [Porphyromonas phage phage023a_KCOM2797]|uniref:Uncharacterized protein n=1 Tax=Porphyromonas phage phage023a_KCOM2797 TaxID=3154113 RepID=A0AAT9JL84_9CAUD
MRFPRETHCKYRTCCENPQHFGANFRKHGAKAVW